jgi:hypothetical protein
MVDEMYACARFVLLRPQTIGSPERRADFNRRRALFVAERYPAIVTTSEKILTRKHLRYLSSYERNAGGACPALGIATW